MKRSILLICCSALVSFLPAFAEAEGACSAHIKTVPFESKSASAALWRNVGNLSGSLSYETGELLKATENAQRGLEPPKDFCPASCKLRPLSVIALSTVPIKFLTEYKDREKCEKLLKITQTEPFQYADRVFNNMEEFYDWYNDFSQGEGPDGEDLYKRCDGLCSPQYLSRIEKQGENLVVTSDVVCGPARDKGDDTYQINSNFLWVCEDLE